jgi:hypothetical protein
VIDGVSVGQAGVGGDGWEGPVTHEADVSLNQQQEVELDKMKMKIL